MITLHHLNNSRSQGTLWLLEELGVPYEIRRYQRDPETMLAPDSLRAVHPLGKSPVITDDDAVIAETGVILEYILDRYGDGRLEVARESEDYWRYRYWLHYAEASAMPPLLLKLVMDQLRDAPVPFFIKPILKAITGKVDEAFLSKQLETHFSYIESEIRPSGWFVGEELTGADIQMAFALMAARGRDVITRAKHPKTMAFLDRVEARPAYKRALEAGGPFTV